MCISTNNGQGTISNHAIPYLARPLSDMSNRAFGTGNCYSHYSSVPCCCVLGLLWLNYHNHAETPLFCCLSLYFLSLPSPNVVALVEQKQCCWYHWCPHLPPVGTALVVIQGGRCTKLLRWCGRWRGSGLRGFQYATPSSV